jgi:hypothetical protein
VELLRAIVWWPLAIVVGVGLLVSVALAQCMLAELIVRFAARLCAVNLEMQREYAEEWSRVLSDMKPSERPGHAGSLLWAGVRTRCLMAGRTYRGAVQQSRSAVRFEYLGTTGRQPGRSRELWWDLRLAVIPMTGRRRSTAMCRGLGGMTLMVQSIPDHLRGDEGIQSAMQQLQDVVKRKLREADLLRAGSSVDHG